MEIREAGFEGISPLEAPPDSEKATRVRVGVALIVAALIVVSAQLESTGGVAVARIASGGAIASLAVAAALQAVDGIALKLMVDAWAAKIRGGPHFAVVR